MLKTFSLNFFIEIVEVCVWNFFDYTLQQFLTVCQGQREKEGTKYFKWISSGKNTN